MNESSMNNLRIIKDLTLTDFKLKYNRSVLGFFWSLLKPLLMLATLYIVFHMLIRLDVPHYELFLLLGIILWSFFTEATSFSMNAMARNTGLIRKTVFNKRLIIISTNLSSLITLLLNLAVFFLFVVLFDAGFSWHLALFAVLLAELFILTLGTSFLLSAFYVRFRDLGHIWDVLMQIGFWVTPIIYPISLIPRQFHNIYILNPLARIIEDSRNALIFHKLPPLDFSYLKHVSITLIICVGMLVLGIIIFNRKSRRFAEQV
jgi:ABC-2 type transport system permease protein